eukprot:2192943-Amphidinium_carterae.1
MARTEEAEAQPTHRPALQGERPSWWPEDKNFPPGSWCLFGAHFGAHLQWMPYMGGKKCLKHRKNIGVHFVESCRKYSYPRFQQVVGHKIGVLEGKNSKLMALENARRSGPRCKSLFLPCLRVLEVRVPSPRHTF